MKKKEKINFLILVFFLGIATWQVVKGYYDREEVHKNPQYTIGTTIRKYRTAKTGLTVDAYYYVNNIRYKVWGNYIEGVKYKGGRYYVKFSKANPKKSIIMFNKPVPEYIKEAPLIGWNRLPE